MNKILLNFLVVGVSIASIQAASAVKQMHEDAGEKKITNYRFRPQHQTRRCSENTKQNTPSKLALRAQNRTCSRVFMLDLQPIPMNSLVKETPDYLKPQHKVRSRVQSLNIHQCPVLNFNAKGTCGLIAEDEDEGGQYTKTTLSLSLDSSVPSINLISYK